MTQAAPVRSRVPYAGNVFQPGSRLAPKRQLEQAVWRRGDVVVNRVTGSACRVLDVVTRSGR